MKTVRFLMTSLAVLLALSACKKEKQPEDTGAKSALKVSLVGASDVIQLMGEAKANVLVSVTAEPATPDPLTIKLTADPSKVDAYNAANGTNYKAVPSSAFTLEDGTCIMPRYQKQSTSLGLVLSANGIEDDQIHVLPVLISKVDGSTNVDYANSAAYILVQVGGSSSPDANPQVTDLSTLQDVIDGCVAGAVVKVAAGTLTGKIVLKDGVNISGGWDPTFKTCDPATYVTVIDANHTGIALTQEENFVNPTTVSGLTLKNGKSSGNGGCAYIKGNTTLENCIFTGGEAEQGAGLYIDNNGVVKNSFFSGNNTTGHGGGVYLDHGFVYDCIVEKNEAKGNGGGLAINNSGHVERTIFRNNKAAEGGGVNVRAADYPGAYFSDCLIISNTCSIEGSGINMYASSARPVSLHNNTIANNHSTNTSSSQGYGLYSSDKHMWFTNNIVWGNTNVNNTDKQIKLNCGETAYIDGPYFQNNAYSQAGIWTQEGVQVFFSGNINLNPEVAPFDAEYKLTDGALVNAGLTTFDYVEEDDSPRNEHNERIPSSMTIAADAIDLAGNPRIFGETIDLGCYELQSAPAEKNYITVSDLSKLQETINAADGSKPIRVGAGTLTGVQIKMKEGVNVSGGWNQNFTVCDPAQNVTILDGNGELTPLVQEANFNTKTTFSGFTIKNGKSTNDGGGNVYLRKNGVLENCVLTGGSATGEGGGGIFVRDGGIIQNCHVYGNTSTGHAGGIFLNDGYAYDCIVENNTGGGNGGGISCNSWAYIDRCIIRNNTAREGGAINLRSSYFPGMTVSNCLIYGNSATEQGSAFNMYDSSWRPITVYNCTIVENKSENAGCYAVYTTAGQTWLVNNIIWGNTVKGADSQQQIYLNAGKTDFVYGPYARYNAYAEGALKVKSGAQVAVENNITLTAKPYDNNFKPTSDKVINAGATTFECSPKDNAPRYESGAWAGERMPGSMTIGADWTDLAGTLRIKGSGIDLGCYEVK